MRRSLQILSTLSAATATSTPPRASFDNLVQLFTRMQSEAAEEQKKKTTEKEAEQDRCTEQLTSYMGQAKGYSGAVKELTASEEAHTEAVTGFTNDLKNAGKVLGDKQGMLGSLIATREKDRIRTEEELGALKNAEESLATVIDSLPGRGLSGARLTTMSTVLNKLASDVKKESLQLTNTHHNSEAFF